MTLEVQELSHTLCPPLYERVGGKTFYQYYSLLSGSTPIIACMCEHVCMRTPPFCPCTRIQQLAVCENLRIFESCLLTKVFSFFFFFFSYFCLVAFACVYVCDLCSDDVSPAPTLIEACALSALVKWSSQLNGLAGFAAEASAV